ncbi:hypothetical protein LCGC14_1848020 [marine sediment metagenome]|uniref:Cytochrome c domain-containing protein n=1 Tax=marine sediment metagenome TaxID=412755 RepID=A0A0F9GB47_9ZZZZ
MKGLGSTPSFALLRVFDDWQQRFTEFHALNPHPAFTLIDEVSPPFDPDRQPGIAPLRMTLDDLDAIIAYVATMEPADLGAPMVAN